MAREAERLLAHTGWLPQLLRTSGPAIPADAEPFAEPLPAFLTRDLDHGCGEGLENVAAE